MISLNLHFTMYSRCSLLPGLPSSFSPFLCLVISNFCRWVVYFAAPLCTFWNQPSKFSTKKISYIFSKESSPYIFSKSLPHFLAPRPQKFPKKLALKKFLIFSEKIPNFLKTESPKKLLYFRKRNFLILQKTELFYTSEKELFKKTFLYFSKRNFTIFRERYIQNPRIFRTRSIFRTLVYLEPETYSEHYQKVAT